MVGMDLTARKRNAVLVAINSMVTVRNLTLASAVQVGPASGVMNVLLIQAVQMDIVYPRGNVFVTEIGVVFIAIKI